MHMGPAYLLFLVFFMVFVCIVGWLVLSNGYMLWIKEPIESSFSKEAWKIFKLFSMNWIKICKKNDALMLYQYESSNLSSWNRHKSECTHSDDFNRFAWPMLFMNLEWEREWEGERKRLKETLKYILNATTFVWCVWASLKDSTSLREWKPSHLKMKFWCCLECNAEQWTSHRYQNWNYIYIYF